MKVGDMGLAKFVVGRTYTTCGTPDYFAPEIVKQSDGHDRAVDWYVHIACSAPQPEMGLRITHSAWHLDLF